MPGPEHAVNIGEIVISRNYIDRLTGNVCLYVSDVITRAMMRRWHIMQAKSSDHFVKTTGVIAITIGRQNLHQHILIGNIFRSTNIIKCNNCLLILIIFMIHSTDCSFRRSYASFTSVDCTYYGHSATYSGGIHTYIPDIAKRKQKHER